MNYILYILSASYNVFKLWILLCFLVSITGFIFGSVKTYLYIGRKSPDTINKTAKCLRGGIFYGSLFLSIFNTYIIFFVKFCIKKD